MAFTLAASQAPHAGWLNGALSSTARQYWLRPTQHVPNGPRIASAISGMTEGEFRAVWSDVSGDLFRVRRADDGTLAPILDWNPHMVWSAATEQFLLGGRRGTIKLTAYSDITGQWRELPMPAALGRNINGTAHWYGNTAIDGAGSIYLGTTEFVSQTWSFDPEAEVWTRLADTPSLYQLGSVIEWFASANSGSGGLVKCLPLGTGTGQMILLNAAGTSWSVLASGFGNGQHALVRYHPSHSRLLIVGGTSSLQAATLMDAAGTATAVTNVPDEVLMSGGSWIVAHPSGCWLVRTTNGSAKRLFAAWPNAGYTGVTWQEIGTASPDASLSNPTAWWDATRERVFITAETGLFAWRPVALTNPLGVIAVTDDTDVVSITGTATARGSIAVTDASDLASLTGATPTIGSIAVTDATDVVTLVGTATARGTIAVTDATDIASVTAAQPTVGSIAVVDSSDVVAVVGVGSSPTAQTPPQRRQSVRSELRRQSVPYELRRATVTEH